MNDNYLTEDYERFAVWWEKHGVKAYIGPNGITIKGLCRLAWLKAQEKPLGRVVKEDTK